jgi:fructokinase
MENEVFGGIEAGGTKFVCMIASGPNDIRLVERFPTTNPADTLDRALAFFKKGFSIQPLSAIGVACFGPIDLNPASPTFGYITTTPKPGWENTNIVGILRAALNIPVLMDTDVNAAALSEHMWGSANIYDPLIYLTVGTGIGGGAIVNGKPIHGLVHPEIGHLRIPHNWEADPFSGICPYHGDCFEGLASGPAIQKRWGRAAESLPEDHPAWDLEAHYIALALMNIIVSFSPLRIIVGGGVMQHTSLFLGVRRKVSELINAYIQSPTILKNIDNYIIPPVLGNQSGVLGAIALCRMATRVPQV